MEPCEPRAVVATVKEGFHHPSGDTLAVAPTSEIITLLGVSLLPGWLQVNRKKILDKMPRGQKHRPGVIRQSTQAHRGKELWLLLQEFRAFPPVEQVKHGGGPVSLPNLHSLTSTNEKGRDNLSATSPSSGCRCHKKFILFQSKFTHSSSHPLSIMQLPSTVSQTTCCSTT